MKMLHTVKYHSGELVKHTFSTKAKSDKAIDNAYKLNGTYHTIKCIWVEPVNYPWRRYRIDF